MSLDIKEDQANDLIKQGDTDSAVKLIYEIVVALAKKKDFKKAESWREKMIEINPMALAEIIGSGEVIESEKASAIDYDHKSVWAKLYHSLTVEEGNAFYMKLNQRDFPAGKVIIQQGKLNNTIFFIDSGQLKTIFSQGGKDNFINYLDQGETAGQDTFFKITNCTSSVITVSSAKIRFLDRSAIMEIGKEFPDFPQKLEDYCSRMDSKNAQNDPNKKALERRQLKRYKILAKITVQLVDKKGDPDGPAFNGKLEDISTGGSSFAIACSNKDVGRTLLGRATKISVEFENRTEIKIMGLILGSRFDNFNSHMIHFRFSKPFDALKLKQIVKTSQPE